MRLSLVIAVFCLCCGVAHAQKVWEKDGNIYSSGNGSPRQLTKSGLDSSPALSKDRKLVVFVRATHGKKIATGPGETEATQLWTVDLDGKNPVMLPEGSSNREAKDVLAGLETPQFSPDGRSIYFQSSAFATSGAIHFLDLRTHKQKFICAGNSLEVIQTGEYAGQLIVNQHKYFLGAGSYDWYWLLKADGSEVGPIGEEATNFKELYLQQ